jgi:phage virion morphogenesis protein
MADMSDVMNDIGQTLVANTKARFAAQESPDGTKWAQRSEATLARYAKLGRPFGGILHYTGDMRSFISHSYGPRSTEVGSNAIYAAAMQFGAAQGAFGAFIGKDKRGRDHFHTIPWGNIPARPFLGLSAKDRVDILDILGDWLAPEGTVQGA